MQHDVDRRESAAFDFKFGRKRQEASARKGDEVLARRLRDRAAMVLGEAGRRDEHASGTTSLLSCDNSRVIFSTARPLARASAYKVRAYSASPAPETARFTFAAGGRARLVDLGGRAVKRAGLKRSRDGAITLDLEPFELVTFEVRARSRVP